MNNYEKLNKAMNELKDDELKLCAPFMKGLALYSYAVSSSGVEKETFSQLFNTLNKIMRDLMKVEISGDNKERYDRLTTAKFALIETLYICRNDCLDRSRKVGD